MPVNIKRNVGRPSAVDLALTAWGVNILERVEAEQIGRDFVASEASLYEYEVNLRKENRVDLLTAKYLKYSIEGRGRGPGGPPPIDTIAEWIETKGIPYDDERDLRGMAFLIARKIGEEGNQVYTGRREGIGLKAIFDESFNEISDPEAERIAKAAAARLLKAVKKFKVIR